MRISDWSSDVCSSDLSQAHDPPAVHAASGSDARRRRADGAARLRAALAARQPRARFVLMGSDLFFPEVAAVAAMLRAGLPDRVTTLHFTGLAFGGCHAHPSLADHPRIADPPARVLDSPSTGVHETGKAA